MPYVDLPKSGVDLATAKVNSTTRVRRASQRQAADIAAEYHGLFQGSLGLSMERIVDERQDEVCHEKPGPRILVFRATKRFPTVSWPSDQLSGGNLSSSKPGLIRYRKKDKHPAAIHRKRPLTQNASDGIQLPDKPPRSS
ncbi:hypothetical protein B7463_g2580, partial [Scytalidium lignicola]